MKVSQTLYTLLALGVYALDVQANTLPNSFSQLSKREADQPGQTNESPREHQRRNPEDTLSLWARADVEHSGSESSGSSIEGGPGEIVIRMGYSKGLDHDDEDGEHTLTTGGLDGCIGVTMGGATGDVVAHVSAPDENNRGWRRAIRQMGVQITDYGVGTHPKLIIWIPKPTGTAEEQRVHQQQVQEQVNAIIQALRAKGIVVTRAHIKQYNGNLVVSVRDGKTYANGREVTATAT
ncbi:MAG: hypothetical protein M1821_003261 [Bathelium mastoideum]|nr:MAG: hypothetical protein M1821_003261 [Bathelium mastoideum]KAI9689381.1 MAG: hypothetical protein M1822_010032 [Bathelium mastoideum]